MVQELTQTGETIHVVHDPEANRIAEYLYDTSTLIRQYIWMEGRIVAVVEGGQIFYVRTDHIGRPVFATNDLGVKVWEASYLPFGGVHVATGGIDLRFPGQWFQAESGLHQNWMRDYDPTTGRYIQADPLGLVDGASVYGYALQNPGRYVDQRGENWIRWLSKLRNSRLGAWIAGPLDDAALKFRNFCARFDIDGPDGKLFQHGRGRVLQFRYRGKGGKSRPFFRLDYDEQFAEEERNCIVIAVSKRSTSP